MKGFEEDVAALLRKEGGEFGKVVMQCKEKVMENFDEEAQAVVIEGTGWNYDHDRELLVQDVDAVTGRLRREEIMRLSEKLEKQVKADVEEPVSLVFAKPSETMWDTLIAEFEKIKDAKVEAFKQKAVLGLNATEQDVTDGVEGLKTRAWMCLRDRLDGETEPTHLLLRLREKYLPPLSSLVRINGASFEDKFRYDEQGVPRIWKPSDDIDNLFKAAKESVPRILP